MRAARWIAACAVGCMFFACNAFAYRLTDFNDLGGLAAQSKTAMIRWSLPEPDFLLVSGTEEKNSGPSGAFRGAFDMTPPWTLTSLAHGTLNYSLRGVALNAVPVRLSVSHGRISLESQVALVGEEDSTVGSVPEPSSLYLLVTGSLGLFGIIRKRLT